MTRRERKLLIQTALLGIGLTFAVAIVDRLGALAAFERWLYDRRVEDCQFFTPPPTDKLVHFDIDDAVLELLGAWPWPRSKVAAMISEIHRADARVLGLDIIFPEKQKVEVIRAADGTAYDVDHDKVLAGSISDFGKVLVPISFATPTERSELFNTMRARLLEDLEITDQEMLAFLHEKGIKIRTLKSGINSTRFVRARAEAMFHMVDNAIQENPDVELLELKKKLTPKAFADGLRSTATRLLEQQLEKIRALASLRRHTVSQWATDANVLKVEADQPPIRLLCDAAGGTGFVYYESDTDGLVRSIVLMANHDGFLWPQLGFSLACEYLGADINDIQIEPDRLIIPRQGQPPIVVPTRPRRVRTTGETTDLHMDLPWFGDTENWATMYDPKRARPVQHVPLSKVWGIIETRDRIATNNAAADEAINAIWQLLSPEKRERYEKRKLPLDDPLARQDVIKLVLKDVEESGYMDIFNDMSQAELEKERESLIFVASVRALRNIGVANVQLKEQLATREQWLREQVANRAAIIGWTGTGTIADFVPTPLFSMCPGVVVHGLVFNSVLTNHMWRRAKPWVTSLITAILGLFTVAALCRFSPQGASVVAIALALGYFVINGIVLFDYGDIIVGIAGPLTSVITVWTGCTLFRFVIERAERARITKRFQSYVDPVLVNYVIEHPEKARLEGEMRELSVVFTDLAGFTTLSEKLREKTVAILNEYTELMVPLIRQQNGYVNKFLGDGIMFFYGAPRDNPHHAKDSVTTALRMQQMMPIFNASLTQRELPNVSVRIGICTGPMVVGDAGPATASDYTVLGDTVNLATRLESANKYTQTSIMINQGCADAAGDTFLLRPVGRLQVVGKSEGVMTYEPLCNLEDGTDEQRRIAALTDDVVSAYVTSDFAGCLAAVEAYEAVFGKMKLMTLYHDLATRYLEEGPPKQFKGEIVLESK